MIRLRGRARVVDIELSSPVSDLTGLDGYASVLVLARLYGAPIGYVQIPVSNAKIAGSSIRLAILREHGYALIRELLSQALDQFPVNGELTPTTVASARPAPAPFDAEPLVTVAVCSRDRPDDLAHCLEALSRQSYRHMEILVVDNAPTTMQTKMLVLERFPHVGYVLESRPGLDWARNRAIDEARGELIAFTDDDTLVDPGWLDAMVRAFEENPGVMAVTGLVVPAELETEAQSLFEIYGGFGRGFKRQWHFYDPDAPETSTPPWGAGRFGTGANMAFRRTLFQSIGSFDPALDVGTLTNGGGDLEMFFRTLKHGFPLLYEPHAIVRHRHRRTREQLHTQIANNGIGFYSHLTRSALRYPDERLHIVAFGIYWLWWWNLRRLVLATVRPSRFPLGMIAAELDGSFRGLRRYPNARKRAEQLARDTPELMRDRVPLARRCSKHAQGVRIVDLAQPIHPLADVQDLDAVRIVVTVGSSMLGEVFVVNHGTVIGRDRLRAEIVDGIGLRVVSHHRAENRDLVWAALMTAVEHRFGDDRKDRALAEAPDQASPDRVSASIVIATFDRPDELRRCLEGLVSQVTHREVEIIVIDNHPSSGRTAPVVAEFPGVRCIEEARAGLSYARNAGILASTGDIIVMTDDDVIVPQNWLEQLLAPFARADVMIVTGNVLPLELDSRAQRLFEQYGGLGRGYERLEADGVWFERFKRRAVPTWTLGATANAACRAALFADAQVGLLDEALGAGSPTGCSEDTYLFYKTLKAGFTIVYEPSAFVWHQHRREMAAVRKQIFNYSKGHVAYHLTTLLNHRDARALVHLLVTLPRWRFRQFTDADVRRRYGERYSRRLPLIETAGNVCGPWALWRARRRAARLGRSTPDGLRSATDPPSTGSIEAVVAAR